MLDAVRDRWFRYSSRIGDKNMFAAKTALIVFSLETVG